MVFFVLSGFLLSYSHQRTLKRVKFKMLATSGTLCRSGLPVFSWLSAICGHWRMAQHSSCVSAFSGRLSYGADRYSKLSYAVV